MRTIRVKWEGPFSLDEARGLNDGPGLYQFYGRHVIFGAGVLLYIGKTENTFGQRVTGNYRDWKPCTPWYQDDKEVSVKCGCLYYEGDEGFTRLQKDDPDFSKLLCDVEAFQIFCHSPPYNGDRISSYSGQSLIIENVDKLGDLCERLSTDEITDGEAILGGDEKYLLRVIQVNPKAKTGKTIQSDVFEPVNKKKSSVRHQVSNKVLHEEFRNLFEKTRWITGGKNWSYKFVDLSENESVVLVIEPASEKPRSIVGVFGGSENRMITIENIDCRNGMGADWDRWEASS